MTNPRVHDGLKTPDADRSHTFTAAGMFERKPEEHPDMDSTMINVGEGTGCRR
jgi:hypothetical protein